MLFCFGDLHYHMRISHSDSLVTKIIIYNQYTVARGSSLHATFRAQSTWIYCNNANIFFIRILRPLFHKNLVELPMERQQLILYIYFQFAFFALLVCAMMALAGAAAVSAEPGSGVLQPSVREARSVPGHHKKHSHGHKYGR